MAEEQVQSARTGSGGRGRAAQAAGASILDFRLQGRENDSDTHVAICDSVLRQPALTTSLTLALLLRYFGPCHVDVRFLWAVFLFEMWQLLCAALAVLKLALWSRLTLN